MAIASKELPMLRDDPEAVNRAFSKQSSHFDDEDRANIILQELRAQIYRHVDSILPASSKILELNAGTGIDAERFVRAGHQVHATDLSDGMIQQLQRKQKLAGMEKLTVQQLSFEHLDAIADNDFDLVFSNFGGLNCIRDPSMVIRRLPRLLRPRGFVTLVFMPVISPWEIATVLRGNRNAFRRWKHGGTMAHLEGTYFPTWYHSLSTIRESMDRFDLIRCEGLASLSPPPYKLNFPSQHPRTYKMLRRLDLALGHTFPFNRWADHIIVTMQLKSNS